MTPRASVAWGAVGAALCAGIAYAFVPPGVLPALFLFHLPVGVAAAASVAAAVRHRNTARRAAWTSLAVSMTGFCLGETIWWIYLLRGEDPYPSIADVVFLLAYVPLGLTAWLLVRRTSDDGASWLDAGVVTAVMGLGIWTEILGPGGAHSGEPFVMRLFSLAYPICDLLVIVLVVRMVLHRGARTPATVAFTLGVLMMLAGDLTFSWLDVRGAYGPGSFVETIWVFGYCTFGASGLLPGAADAPRAERAGFGLERGRLALVLACVLVPLGVLAKTHIGDGRWGANTESVALIIAGSVMALVSVRLWGLLGMARRVATRRGEERLSALIHHSSDAVLLVSDDEVITFASPAVREIWGRAPDAIVGTTLCTWLEHDEQTVPIAAGTETAGTYVRATLLHADGQPRAVEGTRRDLRDNPAVGAHVVTLRDVTERRRMEGELTHRAFHDALTGLANRALFLDRLQHALDSWDRRGRPATAVLFIDLDDFKAVNDGIGHAAGDALLVEVAARLTGCARRSDTVARLGGDEFALLLEDLDRPDGAMVLAERVLDELRRPMTIDSVVLNARASAGVAFVDEHSTAGDLLRDADVALYGAKTAGKGRCEVIDVDLRSAAHRRLALKVALPEALGHDQLTLAYQPIRDTVVGRVHGVEALIRWTHPELGQVSPAELIPNAEEHGLIVDIGRWVLDTACADAARWNRSHGSLTVNVNVSAVQLRDPGLVSDVAAALAAHGLDPSLLTLEITESVMVESMACLDALERLRSLGVGIAIDDFGTGYSSLSYLHRLPVTCVKLDRAFTAGLGEVRERALVRSIVSLAHSIDLATVAEGVETAEQLGALSSLGCGLVQGYHVCRPVPAADIDALLDHRDRTPHSGTEAA